MSKYNNYKSLNIRAMKDHPDKAQQAKMIGLFKHNAYKSKKTQAEYFAEIMELLYNHNLIDPISSEDDLNKELFDDLFDKVDE